ncbi:little nuclei4 [Actinidia rufa]|uniref:Little nuclei4 n=1 Tax=Actinidia rufa TaxID=165716 RepID=A0A7J0EJM8_9ERIC|nr:little nuclei4 [Actinidia rufa]
MASPQSERLAITPTPISRVLRTPLGDEAIWKRLGEAGFDEESIKRRDKTALIAYIAKIEAELYDHQYHMGLLILERKEWESKNEQIKASAESAELMYRRDKAAHASALAEAKKQEEKLKKALEIEKECVANIEKALHEMRAECAETKVAADSKLCEGQSMVENAEKKFAEAEAKLHAAKSLEAEASRYHHTAERKLHEVEAREDDIRRRISSFKTETGNSLYTEMDPKVVSGNPKYLKISYRTGNSLYTEMDPKVVSGNPKYLKISYSCDAKEKEILLERQSLYERQKTLQKLQDRLLDGQTLLTKREDYIFSRSQELNRLEKELESSKANTEKDLRALNEERSNLELNVASLSAREEAVIKREYELIKREEELLIRQEKLTSKESDDIQHVMADHDASLRARKSEFEAELEMKQQKMVEEEIVTKRRAWELREMDLRQREDLILEKEHDLEVQSRALADREKELTERTNFLDEKERNLQAAEGEVECTKTLLHKEKEETNNLKFDLQKSYGFTRRERKKLVDQAEEKIGAMKSKTNELSVLEMRLKEEIDTIRAQKLELECRRGTLRIVSIRGVKKSKRYLMEKERAFEEEKKKELQHIASLRETVGNEMEQVNLEMQKLGAERGEIILDRERRDKEWAELNSSIEELMVQRQKLEKQRELLHVDREEILSQIEQMKKLEDLKAAPDCITPPEIQYSIFYSLEGKNKGPDVSSPPVSAPFSWLKRCADTLLERTHSNKKRKQQKDADVPPLEETTDPLCKEVGCSMRKKCIVI